MALTKASRSEGFTLVEVLISMVILGVILTPLVSSFILGIATTSASNANTVNSSDAQNVSAFFSSDVASAETASLATGCGTSGAGSTEVLLLDLGTGATPRYVSYVATSDPTSAAAQGYSQLYTLSRVTCDSSKTALKSVFVALTMFSAAKATCAPVECTSADSKPSTIQLDVTEWGAKPTDDKYSFQVTGARRVTA